MTKTKIKAIIKEANTNSEIKWWVSVNSPILVVLENDYAGGCTFEISNGANKEGYKLAMGLDKQTGEKYGAMLIGDEFFCDAKTTEEAMEKLVAGTVRRFNYYY